MYPVIGTVVCNEIGCDVKGLIVSRDEYFGSFGNISSSSGISSNSSSRGVEEIRTRGQRGTQGGPEGFWRVSFGRCC